MLKRRISSEMLPRLTCRFTHCSHTRPLPFHACHTLVSALAPLNFDKHSHQWKSLDQPRFEFIKRTPPGVRLGCAHIIVRDGRYLLHIARQYGHSKTWDGLPTTARLSSFADSALYASSHSNVIFGTKALG